MTDDLYGRAEQRGEMTVPNLADDPVLQIMARALWALECQRADADLRRVKFKPVAKWADPWAPDGGGAHQRRLREEEASAALSALHAAGYAVKPAEPTDEMVERAFADHATAMMFGSTIYSDAAMKGYISRILRAAIQGGA